MSNEVVTRKTVNPYKTILDAGNAYWMARLAKAAYTKQADGSPDTGKIEEDLQQEDPKFIKVTPANHKSSQGILVEHQDYFAISFRGTDEFQDWLDNVNVIQKELILLNSDAQASIYSGVSSQDIPQKGYFHTGFWQAMEDSWPELFNAYQEYQKQDRKKRQQELQVDGNNFKVLNHKFQTPVRPLFLTGHSLGGAMATLAAVKLLQQDLPFMSVYTFGQPRTMTHKTADLFNSKAKTRFFRFQNNNDIVTRFPARSMNYSHVGSYFHIDADQKIHHDIGYWNRFLGALEGSFEHFLKKGLDCIEDHNMDLYLAAVKKWDRQF